MPRLPSLAATFHHLVLAAAAAGPAAGCFVTTSGCPDPYEGEAELREPVDAELQPLVDACRAAGGDDLAACEPMCRELIGREQGYELGEWDTVHDCALIDVSEGATTALAQWTWAPECIGGRRPIGYTRSRADLATVGGYLAEQARLEAASVGAFADLARALAAHGAPRRLVDACRRAAVEETVHAVLTARLARRHGVRPDLAAPPPAAVPALEQLARDNAVEGCVRESWGALVATWQARAAADPAIRAAMRRIAPDETAHAELSRGIHRWASRRLDRAARARVRDARRAALADLAPAATAAAPAALERAAGLPPAPVAARLFEGLRAVA